MAETAALAIVHAAPVAPGGLADRSFAQGGGAAVIATAPAFAGADLRFAVAGAGASIDPVSGVLTIPTDAAIADALVTVTASNSGGSAEVRFRVAVAPALPAFPAALAAGQWSAAEVRDAAPAGRRRIAIGAGVVVPAGFELRLYSGPVAGGQADPSNRVMQPGELFVSSGTMIVGTTCHNLLYWRRVADGAWAAASAAAISFEIRGLEPAPPLPVAPGLIAAPALAGIGRIGDAIVLDPGAWSGEPAPTLAFAWLRDGAPIPGATGTVYTPGPEDDRAALVARVTATNSAGSRAAETAPLGVAHAAPQAAGELPDEVFDEDSGPQAVPTAHDFLGEDLSFSVTGAGATIDPRTGVLAIPTDAPVSGERVTVTASNSGGSAESAFLVTVEALEPAATRSALYRAAAIPPAGASFNVKRDVGPHEPGRLVWVMVIASDAATVTIDGKPGQLVESGSAGGAVGQIYVSDTTASEVRVIHQGAHLNVPCVLWFTTVGYAAQPAAVRRAGVGASNQNPSSVEIAVPADGAVLAGTRNYNLLTAPAGLQNFATGTAAVGLAGGATAFAAATALTVAAGRDAGAIGGKQLLALALAPADRGGPTDPEPDPEPEPEPEPEEPPVPPTGTPAPTSMQSSVSKDGVTFGFAAPRPVGQYCNGDVFVVGPVTITAISPASRVVSTAGYTTPGGWRATTAEGVRAVNGAELNPVPGSTQGFDQYVRAIGVGGPVYDAAKNVDPAVAGRLTVSEGSVVKAVSVEGDPLEATPSGRSSVMRYVVLTVVPRVPVAGAFRPPVRGASKQSYWTEHGIDYAKLRKLAPVAGMPDIPSLTAATSAHFMTWQSYHNDGQQAAQSRQYEPYGRDLGWFFGDCLLRLHCDHPVAEKRPLAINLVQIGIDLCGHVRAGGSYPGEGSTMTGRKGVAVTAAVLLGDAAMMAAVSWRRRKISFADDSQIFEVGPEQVGVDLGPGTTAGRARRFPYQPEDVGFPEWVTPTLEMRNAGLNPAIQATYRPIWATGVLPNVLAAHLLEGGVAAWDCDPVFDYFDRIARVFEGHPGRWDFTEQDATWLYEWQHNFVRPRHMAAWRAWRPLSGRPVWTGRPERPHPPALTAAGRTINGTFDSYQSDNGRPITRRDVRYRQVGESAWRVVQGVGNGFSLPNLAARTEHEVQVRLVNAAGGGPWSVNVPLNAAAAHNANFRARATTGA